MRPPLRGTPSTQEATAVVTDASCVIRPLGPWASPVMSWALSRSTNPNKSVVSPSATADTIGSLPLASYSAGVDSEVPADIDNAPKNV